LSLALVNVLRESYRAVMGELKHLGRPASHRFPTDLIYLSDPFVRPYFKHLFRGYDDEASLKEMISIVQDHTMVAYDGLIGLLSMIRYCEETRIPGDFVEVGTWRGGCTGLMALGAQRFGTGSRIIQAFDSFQGLPQPVASKDFDGIMETEFRVTEVNAKGKLEPINALVASIDDFRALLFETIGYSEEQVVIHKGWFQETMPIAAPKIGEIAVLRLDGDLYESYKIALEYLYPKVTLGGFVIIDDWILGGCRNAVTEYFQNQGLRPYLWSLDRTTRCFQRC